ncbi:MAG: hypothetical protein AB7R55_15625 [Gemmatimonadales bacterium]
MSHHAEVLVLSFLAVGATACGAAQKEAEEALDRADRFYGAMQTEAMKVVPSLTAPIGDSLEVAKQLMAAGKYREAQAKAVDVAGEAVRVAKLVPRKRDELDSTYKSISVEITYPVRQVVNRIRQLNTSGALPRGLSRAGFDSLKTDVTTWEDAWKAAQDWYQKGEIDSAAGRAAALKASVQAAMSVLAVK